LGFIYFVAYSLKEAAKAPGLDVQKYLERLLYKMRGYIKNPDGIEALLPWSASLKELCASNHI